MSTLSGQLIRHSHTTYDVCLIICSDEILTATMKTTIFFFNSVMLMWWLIFIWLGFYFLMGLVVVVVNKLRSFLPSKKRKKLLSFLKKTSLILLTFLSWVRMICVIFYTSFYSIIYALLTISLFFGFHNWCILWISVRAFCIWYWFLMFLIISPFFIGSFSWNWF